jgi:hypothetical protein
MYFDLSLAVIVQVYAIFKAREYGLSIDQFFGSGYEITNITLTLVYLVAIFWFLISGYRSISREFDQKTINKTKA